MTIKIITGWSSEGGSTTAFVNLTNLFNKNNIDTILYGQQNYHLDKCKADKLENFKIDLNDTLIFHFFNPGWQTRPPIKGKFIYSCHEKNLRPMNTIDYTIYDKIHYVSEPQKEYHNLDYPYFIIPNVSNDLKSKGGTKTGVVGIIGSIDRNKQVDVSIQRAIDDGFQDIRIFGKITDYDYFKSNVEPLLCQNIRYMGFVPNQEIYDQISDVYHSSISECLSYVKMECIQLGINFHGNESTNNSGYVIKSNEEILEIWKKELEI